MKVLTVLGTRPEAIKMAPVIHALRGRSKQTYVCTTGQHRDILHQALALFQIQPDFDLDLMRPRQSPSEVAARVLLAMDRLLADLKPEWMLVQGDTTTVMAASIAAHHRGVRIGHVEAGLRTYDRKNPFPEEMNRVLTDHVSELHFAPTSRARENLLREGISPESIHVTGNTAIDALHWCVRRPIPEATQKVFDHLGFNDAGDRKNVLVTVHRRENHGAPLIGICRALRKLANRRTDCRFIYPVHPNPNILQPVRQLLDNVPRISLLPPLDYITLVHLMRRSALILTDSGGIQEEAPSFGVPVLVLRETTERPEAVEAGGAVLVGAAAPRIIEQVERRLDGDAPQGAALRGNPYGDGHAARRIVDILLGGDAEDFTPREQHTKLTSSDPTASAFATSAGAHRDGS